jgi:hypothetical protein
MSASRLNFFVSGQSWAKRIIPTPHEVPAITHALERKGMPNAGLCCASVVNLWGAYWSAWVPAWWAALCSRSFEHAGVNDEMPLLVLFLQVAIVGGGDAGQRRQICPFSNPNPGGRVARRLPRRACLGVCLLSEIG